MMEDDLDRPEYTTAEAKRRELKRPNSIRTRAVVVTDPVIHSAGYFAKATVALRTRGFTSKIYFLKTELLVELIVRLTVDLDIRHSPRRDSLGGALRSRL
jgi:hypothetical protein